MTSSNSLYGNTPNSQGNVSSSNLTTLYSGNAVTVPSNGNLVVPGTLTVNGCAILTDCTSFNLLPFTATSVSAFGSATAVTIGSGTGITTINNQLATANYTFPVADGTATQVLTTDGAGTLAFSSTGGLGKTYDITSSVATGGANFNLNSDVPTTDTIKFAEGSGISIVSTDANTITIGTDGSGQTFGNITVAVVDNNTISTTTGNLELAAAASVNITPTDSVNLVTTGVNSIVLSHDFAGGGYVAVGDSSQTGVLAANGVQNLLLLADPANVVSQAAIQLEAVSGDVLLSSTAAGAVRSSSNTTVLGTGSAATTLTTNGAYGLTINTNGGTTSGSIVIPTGANQPITIETNGTGNVQLNADTLRVGDQNANATVTTYGTGDLTLSTNEGTNTGTIVIADGVNGDISVSPNGTGLIILGKDVELATGYIKNKPNTATAITISSNGAVSSSTLTVANADITLTPDSVGNVIIDGATWPGTSTGVTVNSVLTNDGSGILSWALPGGGGSTFGNVTVGVDTDQTISTTSGDLILQTAAGVNAGTITMTSGVNGTVAIAPNGSGPVHLTTDVVRVGNLNTLATVTTNGTGGLTLSCNGGASGGNIAISAGVNGAVTLTTTGSGVIGAFSSTLRLGEATGNATLTSYGAHDLILSTNSGLNSGSITITDGVNGAITLTPDGTGNVNLDADTVRVGDINATAEITTNGTGDLQLSTNNGTNSGYISIANGADGVITLEPNGTGDVLLNADTVRVGDLNSQATVTTNGTGDLVLNTNNGTNSGYISLANGANQPIIIEPNGSGDVFLATDQVVVGDAAATATITSNGAGNLVLNTNAGTNAGSLTFANGVNGNITVAPNGTGILLVTGITAGVISPTPGTSAILGRHQATTSSTTGNYSFNVQKQRTDILLAAMTSEPAVVAFSVRDSGSNNRVFARLNATYQGTASNPFFLFQHSVDGFTTTTQTALLGAGVATWGALNTAYTHSTNGTGDLTLNTNSGTNAGSIVLTNGVNGNITIAPNGTGQTKVTNLNYNEVVYTAGTTTGTITPNCANGTIQSITLTGSITFSAFTTPISGQTMTLIITQPASGGPYTLTSTMLFAGASKTLSTAANAVDILTVSYIGTTYYASLAKGFA